MWGLWSVCACWALGGYCLWYGSTSGGAVRKVVCVHVPLESSRARPPQPDTVACHRQCWGSNNSRWEGFMGVKAKQ